MSCSLSLKGRKEKSPAKAVHQLLFKGRIPLESLEIEDVEDGRSDYHTNGITVTNGWKCRNSVKNKWFVLIAKTPQDKKDWLDAIRALKDKRKRKSDPRDEQTTHACVCTMHACTHACACTHTHNVAFLLLFGTISDLFTNNMASIMGYGSHNADPLTSHHRSSSWYCTRH